MVLTWPKGIMFSCALHLLPLLFFNFSWQGDPTNYRIKYISLGAMLNNSDITILGEQYDFNDDEHNNVLLSEQQIKWDSLPKDSYLNKPDEILSLENIPDEKLIRFLGTPVLLNDDSVSDQSDIPAVSLMDLKLEKP